MADPGDNGEVSEELEPLFTGKDKVLRRREFLIRRIIENPDVALNPLALAAELGVSVRTLARDLEAPEIIGAIDESIEQRVDGTLLAHAWNNVRRRIIVEQDYEASIDLIKFRAKQAATDRAFDQFQKHLAIAMAETLGCAPGELPEDIDPNEFIVVEIKPPTRH